MDCGEPVPPAPLHPQEAPEAGAAAASGAPAGPAGAGSSAGSSAASPTTTDPRTVPARLVLEDGTQWFGRVVVWPARCAGGAASGGSRADGAEGIGAEPGSARPAAAGPGGTGSGGAAAAAAPAIAWAVTGEVVFNTSMTGYQELLSDPSYDGQIVVLTYPLVGNYGVHDGEDESAGPRVQALIARELFDAGPVGLHPLAAHLARAGVPAADGFDTRALTLHLRRHGTLRGVLTTDLEAPAAALVAQAQSWRPPSALEAGTRQPYRVEPAAAGATRAPARHAVLVDFGVKRNILRALVAQGWRVTVVPALTPAHDVLALQPDAVILSNGPGDPRDLGPVLDTVRRLAETVPTFGICLGHQLLGLAFGGRAYKLPFGHRGANHPVKEIAAAAWAGSGRGDGRVFMTSQNHGYALDAESLEAAGLIVTHVNLNDGTVEGLCHPELPVRGLQFHPEAAPGPRDAAPLLAEFLRQVTGGTPAGGANEAAGAAVGAAAAAPDRTAAGGPAPAAAGWRGVPVWEGGMAGD
ncbi:carbamoyl-phosphate synthase, small subunit [Thermaerobacter marianensis DSM 12885]|uniref:Carbamoyl phosphate synthase small chain n=1 Tax=Thermaerobacter marianensis (strain ATCC 700841 / DSM 12885 / JCM 10246 / 7p75a) TaxID=644966 RepID=E6SJH6_THEM7|nr:glutamine-hydrolyzing carbamoyl-phosphate synthase small subunit [Thermaerobacter marianensis]ADU52131.1 carbamoyl-phosphate synthase, small subunit [Thermaerobacter marianensis DSM 12885]